MIVNVLNNKSVWKLLALMSYSPGAGYTRKELLRLLKWNNLSLDRSLKKLAFYKIIIRKGRVIRLNFAMQNTQLLLGIIEHDKKKLNFPSFELFMILVEFIRLIEGKDVSEAYLFGSHAKKTASAISDIDIAVFSDKKINLIASKDSILQEFGREIQLHYFATREKGRLVDEIKKHGVQLI